MAGEGIEGTHGPAIPAEALSQGSMNQAYTEKADRNNDSPPKKIKGPNLVVGLDGRSQVFGPGTYALPPRSVSTSEGIKVVEGQIRTDR